MLKPGDYAQVNIGLPGTGAQLRLPASALMFRATALEVATLGKDNRIVMKPITIGTDLGTQVIVASGLNPGDRVVNNPPIRSAMATRCGSSPMRSRAFLWLGFPVLLAGCDLAPDYKVPETPPSPPSRKRVPGQKPRPRTSFLVAHGGPYMAIPP